MKKLFVMATMMVFFCGAAQSAAIYTESVGGDLLGFAFVIPVGTTLSSASLAANLDGGLLYVDWQFKKGSAALFGGTLLETVGSTQNFTLVPQAADTYQIYGNSISAGPNFLGNGSYVFSFEVTDNGGGFGVPEPGTMALLGTGGGWNQISERSRLLKVLRIYLRERR